MPTFTAMALDRLIEPGTAKSMVSSRDSNDSRLERRNSTPNTKDRETDVVASKLERGVNIPPNPKLSRGASVPPASKLDREVPVRPNQKLGRQNSSPTSTTSDIEQKHRWTQISPALYATPKSTPLPDSPSSFPPSPYIINHKRRGPRLMKSFSEDDVATRKPAVDEVKMDGNGSVTEMEVVNTSKDDSCILNTVTESTMDECSSLYVPGDPKEQHLSGNFNDENGSSDVQNGPQGQNGALKHVTLNLQQEGEDDDFIDLQEMMTARVIIDNEGGCEERPLKPMTPMAEFYDAWEELSSESGSHLSLRDIEAEAHEIRLCLLMEIEKRKQVEETLNNMQNQWQRIREQLSHAGLTLPEDFISHTTEEQSVDSAADLCQQVYLARFVSNAIGRGTARAEVEMEMEAQINLKNFEIARLCDRLRYYEAVNQEMSQRNQEVMETNRRLRQRRKRRQKWVWGSIAAVVSVGSAVLAHSYFKSGKGSSSQSSPSHASEVEQIRN